MESLNGIRRFTARFLLAAMLLLPLVAGLTGTAAAEEDGHGEARPGAVFTQTNAAGGNEILVYARLEDGTLSFQDAYSTGGLGSGAGLGSQGALALSKNSRWLLAVNAGSSQVSVFAVKRDGLVLTDVVDSGGAQPISLTLFEDLVYVLNAGDPGNIAGFRLSGEGELAYIEGSAQPLSNGGQGASPGPAQISFKPDGSTLVVTEKATNLIDTYVVEDGIAGSPVSHPSAGMTPFGFAFNRRGTLIVSEAFGGAVGQSALSSYDVYGNELETISPSVGTTQTAACWVVVSKNGKVAYTTNAGSGSISSYRVARDGSISLENATAGLTGEGSSPTDMALSKNGQFLFSLNSGADTISAFQAHPDGSLSFIGDVNVPDGAVGLAAR